MRCRATPPSPASPTGRRPTSIRKIVEINFNPYWTVPVSIVRRDLIPKMQAEPDYLDNNHIRIFDMRGDELTPSQINWYSDRGGELPLQAGSGRLQFAGLDAHQLPEQGRRLHARHAGEELFGEDMRFHSSGCVRVQNVRELVNWLLIETPGWSRQEIDAVIKSGERKDAKVARPVPLYWVYVTAWATPDGVTQFREDIYNRDGLGPVGATKRG